MTKIIWGTNDRFEASAPEIWQKQLLLSQVHCTLLSHFSLLINPVLHWADVSSKASGREVEDALPLTIAHY